MIMHIPGKGFFLRCHKNTRFVWNSDKYKNFNESVLILEQ